MKKLTKLLHLCVISITANVYSDTVDESQIVEFQSGSPASAADVNQNFQALIDAINDNAASLQHLHENITLLPSLLIRSHPTLSENIKGSIYKVFTHEIGLATASETTPTGENPIVATTRENLLQTVFSEEATLTLNDDGSFDFVFSKSEREVVADKFANNLDSDPPDDPGMIQKVRYSLELDDEDVDSAATGTWTLLYPELHLAFASEGPKADELIKVNISPDGNVIMFGSHTEDSRTYSISPFPDFSLIDVLFSQVVMGVRAHKPEPDAVILYEDPEAGMGDEPIELENDAEPIRFFDQGEVIDEQFEIENDGDADLLVRKVVLIQQPGSGFAIDEIVSPVTLAPDSSIEILVTRLWPVTTTVESASIYIITNDPDAPVFIFNIQSFEIP